MEIIVLAVIVILGIVIFKFNSKDSDPDLEQLSADQMQRQVKLLRQWIDRYETLPNPPDNLKAKYEYKKTRLKSAMEIWGRKIKEAHSAPIQETPAKVSGDLSASLRRQLDEFEAGVKQLDPPSLCSIGSAVEFLQDGFIQRHGTFEQFVSKGGDLGEYVNILLKMALEYRSKDSPYGEWAARLCAIHVSAVHIGDSELELRAKTSIDNLVKQASMFDR